MMKIYFVMVNVLLLTFSVYWGINGFYAIIVPTAVGELPPNSRAETVAIKKGAKSLPLSAYKSIVARNLFKVATDIEPHNKPSADLVVDSLKPTRLKLTLLGTISADNTQNRLAWAVIQEQGRGKQNLYRVGDSIKNAKLKLVLREKVVLAIDGQDEILEMEKAAKKSLNSKAAPGSPLAPVSNISLNRKMIQKATANIGQLMEQTRIRPHFLNGKADGLKLSRIKPSPLLRQMKLRSGDVITGVNGEPVTSLSDIQSAYINLKSNDSVALEIKRNGRRQTLNYRFE